MEPRLNASLVQFGTVSVLTGSRTKHCERPTECRSGVEIPAADDTLTLCRGRGEKTLARPPYNRRASLVPPNRAALINYTPQATHDRIIRHVSLPSKDNKRKSPTNSSLFFDILISANTRLFCLVLTNG